MSVLIVGGIAVDDIQLPTKKLEQVVGGSTIYASWGASLFTKTYMSGVVGNDFPEEYLKRLQKRGVDMTYLQKSDKPSFWWSARYSQDLREITTIAFKMNAFDDFDANKLAGIEVDAAFISNIDPSLQLAIIKQLPSKTIKVLDSMELWMVEKRDALKEALKLVDVFMVSEREASFLVPGNPPVPKLIEQLMQFGPKVIVYKKGEYGLTMYGKMGTLMVPSYPLVYAVDPSGAGDVLGGVTAAVLGHFKEFNEKTMKTAVLLAGTAASLTVEDFITEGIADVTKEELLNRTKLFMEQLPCPDKVLMESL